MLAPTKSYSAQEHIWLRAMLVPTKSCSAIHDVGKLTSYFCCVQLGFGAGLANHIISATSSGVQDHNCTMQYVDAMTPKKDLGLWTALSIERLK
jgi:hypothetical protein